VCSFLNDRTRSNWNDTDRRISYLKAKGILFLGTGVSGGEEGALTGPSIMPGGRYVGDV
jgi:6-phosphogluconate dehydrogenase